MPQPIFPVLAMLRAYLAVLCKRPHRALPIAYWWITGRRLRARLRLSAAIASLPDHYRIWLSLYQPGGTSAYVGSLPARDGAIGLAIHLHISPGQMGTAPRAIASVLHQLGTEDELYVSASAAVTGLALSVATGTFSVYFLPDTFALRADALRHVLAMTALPYLMPLDAEAALTPGAVETFARAITDDPDHDTVFYADQDERSGRNIRKMPWLKPEWDEDLFLAQDYISGACALPVPATRRAIGTSTSDDSVIVYEVIACLVLGAARALVRHIHYVAVTLDAGTWCRDSALRADVLRRLIAEKAIFPAGMPSAVPIIEEGEFGTLAPRWPLSDPLPKVSVVVPTRDRLDLLAICVEGVLHHTHYPNIELIIADNGSVEPETLAYLDRCAADPRVKIVRWPHPYNYSAINNAAIMQAGGAYLCLLNNDTEVIDPSWLHTMMALAVRPGIGAVGARLLYPDRSVQHAGVVVGMGGAAGHAHRGLAEGEAGYFAQALVTRGATAVTAACLVVAREKFEAVGGLDAEKLPIAYNDVDLCLKLRAAGWRNVYAAQAVLIHHEGKSRGLDFAPEHLERYIRELGVFRQRWGAVGFQDPLHHPALDAASETYRLKL